jgi:hypothetical protein
MIADHRSFAAVTIGGVIDITNAIKVGMSICINARFAFSFPECYL